MIVSFVKYSVDIAKQIAVIIIIVNQISVETQRLSYEERNMDGEKE